MAGISGIGIASQSDSTNRAPRFGQTRPITRLSTGSDGREAKGSSVDPVLSADGSTLAFASDAGNLVDGDTNGVRDIFVKNLQTNAVTRISVAADGTEADDASDGLYRAVSLSADGKRVAFASEADNLVAGDTNGASDIFVWDRSTGAVTRVSIAADGTQTPNGSSSTNPVISPDGTKVAYVSTAGNLVPGDTNGARDIFIRDLVTGTVTRIDTAADGTQAGTGSDSFNPVFSADGTKIAFVSTAGNLGAGETNGIANIFVKDLTTQAVTRVSTAPEGALPDGGSGSPVFSADGTKVAFVSKASNLVADDTNGTPDIFVKDLITGTVTRASTGSNREQLKLGGDLVPAFSPDGTKIAFVDSLTKQAYVKDLNTDALTAIAPVPNASKTQRVAFSADGTQLIFVSGDGTLVPGDTNEALDVFSAWTGQTTTGLVRDKADQVSSGTSGKLAFSDEDVGDTHTVTVKPGDGTVGTLTARIDRDSGTAAGVIAWDYTVNHKAVASLAKGQTKTETFTVTVDDGHGGTADQVVTITVVGDNDKPGLAAFGGSVQDKANQETASVSGSQPFTDLDVGDTHTITVKRGEGTVGTLTATIGKEPDGDGPGSIAWTYTVDHKAVAGLGHDETKIETFTVTVDDGKGGTVDQAVTITVRGPNAAPHIGPFGPFERVSTDTKGHQANGASPHFVLSPDGNTLFFSSDADNLVDGDTNSARDIFKKDLRTGDVTRVSLTADKKQADGPSDRFDLSADGNKLVFYSDASNIVPDDTNGQTDIFVRTLDTGDVIRASTSATNEQTSGSVFPWTAATVDANGPAAISRDGKKVAFTTGAYLAADTNPAVDVFVKEIPGGGVKQVSTTSNGGQASDGYGSAAPVFSPDGTKVAFVSLAGNLVDKDGNGTYDIFLKDLETNATISISSIQDGTTGNGTSLGAAFSPDGGSVIFSSDANNLVPNDTNGTRDIFRKDLKTLAVTRLSTDSTGSQLDFDSAPNFALSADGTKLAFVSGKTGLIYVKDLVTESLTPVAPATGNDDLKQLQFSPDGTELYFVSSDSTLVSDDTNSAPDVFKVRIAQTITGFVQDKADQDTSSTSGALSFTDPDAGDTHTVTVKPGTGAVGTLTATIAKEPGSDGPGSIAWTYTVDHKTVPALAAGESRVETFTVTLDDGHGGTSDQVVTITVRGPKPPAAAPAGGSTTAADPAPASTAQSGSTGSGSTEQPSAYTAHVVNAYQAV